MLQNIWNFESRNLKSWILSLQENHKSHIT